MLTTTMAFWLVLARKSLLLLPYAFIFYGLWQVDPRYAWTAVGFLLWIDNAIVEIKRRPES